jgi:site-specific DNA recombinase
MKSSFRYIIYCRKSSEEDTKQLQSLDIQQKILTTFAKEKKLDVVQVFRESKTAWKDGERTDYYTMLQMIKDGKADAILVYNVDRISRNLSDAAIVSKMLQSGELKEIRTPSRTYQTIEDLLSLGIEFAVAQYYSSLISKRVKEGHQEKVARGEYPAQAPVGYVNRTVRGVSNIYPDELKAPYIKRVFSLYSTGNYSYSQLARYLNDKGIKTRKDKPIRKTTIERILKDPVYYGFMMRNGVLYAGIWEKLITKDLFDTVQDVMAGKPRSKAITSPREFLYRDFMTCSVCGCKITATEKKGRYIYYYCANGKKVCDQHKTYIEEDCLDEQFIRLFYDFTLDKEMAYRSFSMYQKSMTQDRSLQVQQIEHIHKEIESNTAQIDHFLNLSYTAQIDPQLLNVKIKDLQAQNKRLEEKCADASKEIDVESTLELSEKALVKLTTLGQMYENGKYPVRRKLLQSLLWNSELRDQEIVSVQYKRPWSAFENLNKTRDIASWRGGRGSNPRPSQ